MRMQVDVAYLRQLYGSLSDEALLDVNRADLVDEAKKCYDAEVAKRELSRAASSSRAREGVDELREEPGVPASSVLATAPRRLDLERAFEILQGAGISCSIELRERAVQEPVTEPKTEWALLVPDQSYLRASNILDREIYNQDDEANWVAYLERLSDKELLALDPEEIWCGLFDLVERVTRVYAEELTRRRLKKPSA